MRGSLGHCDRCHRLSVLYFPFSETTPCTVPAGRVRVIPARSSPAAHVLSRLPVGLFCIFYQHHYAGVKMARPDRAGFPSSSGEKQIALCSKVKL
ncbi:hypothetical protein CXB56_28070 (plasmid) [Escherichia coli]|nr:hypothetical protein CXB56_28070 [Escherichia coli]OYI82216.1 hypothetical protein CI689_09840 [Escherichia coli]OYJ26182.1 hypothetical protein CI738_10380 [Escherichia coli]OZN00773.1 hypothetical protein CF018_19990 [Escherichia coli]QKY83974.1 hypothetical protein [Escherichia coli]